MQNSVLNELMHLLGCALINMHDVHSGIAPDHQFPHLIKYLYVHAERAQIISLEITSRKCCKELNMKNFAEEYT